MKVIFLVSGDGGNLKYVYKCRDKLKITIPAVIGDRECKAIHYSRKMKISTFVIEFGDQTELQRLINKIQPDIVVTTVHKILNKETLSVCNAKFINLHYSLLPDYRGMIGMKPVEEAIKDKKNIVGVTLHEVNNILDGGDVISQAIIDTRANKLTKNPNKIKDTVFFCGAILLVSHLWTERHGIKLIRECNVIVNNNKVKFTNFVPFRSEFLNKVKSEL